MKAMTGPNNPAITDPKIPTLADPRRPKSTLIPLVVPGVDLGYKRGMRHETVVAKRWGTPLAEYLEWLRAGETADSTIRLRSYQIRVLSRGFLNFSPWDVTGPLLVAFLASQTTWHRDAKRAARSAYRSFFGWALEKGYIQENPALELRKIKAVEGVPRPAAKPDVIAAIEQADERVRMMIYLGALSGLRRHEIGKVHTRDVVLDQDGYSLRVVGKGSKPRTVPLPPVVYSWLLSVRAENGGLDTWAFPSYHRGQNKGQPAEDHLQADWVGKLISRALPPGVTPHQLRHRFATDYYVATNNDLLKVREALGHTSVATTQIYTQIPKSGMSLAMEKMMMGLAG